MRDCVDRAEADLWEKLFIDTFKSTNRELGYNVAHGGFTNPLIAKETKEKHRFYMLGKKASPEAKENMRKAHLGKKLSLEQRLKIGIASRGRKHSEESRKKISAARFKRNYGTTSEQRKEMYGWQTRGRVKSPEEREKLSRALKGRVAWNKGISGSVVKLSNEERAVVNIRAAETNKARHHKRTEEFCEKMRILKLGRKQSEKTILKRSLAIRKFYAERRGAKLGGS